MPRDDLIAVRRGTEALWITRNPVLELGEIGYAYDTTALKIGDGVTPWNDLSGFESRPLITRLEFDDVISDITTLQEREDRNAYTYTQPTPAATWTIPHPLGRLPAVSIYINGEEVDSDVSATTSVVTITHAQPQSGQAVLS